MLNRELTIAVIYGHVLSTKYLVEIVGADLKIYWDTFHHVFLIKDTEKRFRFLNFLYYSKVLCQYMEFDYEAQEGNYENVVWLVEHGYKGWDALSELEEDLNEQGALDV